MFVFTMKFDRKKAIFIVLMAALVLFGIIMLAGIDRDGREKGSSAATESGRLEYLESCNRKVESPAMSREEVLIPKSFSPVFEDYNALQQAQGFDLSKYAGKDVELYTYKVTNHPAGENVMARLYVSNGKVIGGDVHSSALDGFMEGLKATKG